MLGLVETRFMTVTDFYLWALVTNLVIVFGTIDTVSRLWRVLTAAEFATRSASLATLLIKHAAISALEAAVTLLIMQPTSRVRRFFVYVLLGYTIWALCSFLLLLELAVATHCYHYHAAIHRAVVGVAILYALASAASWGLDA